MANSHGSFSTVPQFPQGSFSTTPQFPWTASAFSGTSFMGANNNTSTGFRTQTTPAFGSQSQVTLYKQPTLTPPPAATAQTTQSGDKGQVLQCLQESKNIQLSILNELKAISGKVQGNAQTTKVQHLNVYCNVCQKLGDNISGFRYKCLICKDFDLCETCEATVAHDPNHVFIKIKDTNLFNNLMAQKPVPFSA